MSMNDPRSSGVAGRIARAFINSKLTPLIVIAAVLLGVAAIVLLPREEEPQIKVPMIDVFAAAPGRSAVEVERQVVAPLEKEFWSIPGVEYVYSTSSSGRGLLVIRFRVGEDPDRDGLRRTPTRVANAYAELFAGLRVEGRRCLDAGASTGGFTDVLLSHGAARVYAVDVGTNQLAWKLRQDPRVVVHEQTNARTLDASIIPELVDVVVCDASFIGIAKVLGPALGLAKPSAATSRLAGPRTRTGQPSARRTSRRSS